MELLWYKLPSGDEPARRFIGSLGDPVGRKAFFRRLFQISSGLPGDHKPLGDELWEFRIHVGPGYRLYAGRMAENRYVLLVAGTKSTQSRDIAQARRWWKGFRE